MSLSAQTPSRATLTVSNQNKQLTLFRVEEVTRRPNNFPCVRVKRAGDKSTCDFSRLDSPLLSRQDVIIKEAFTGTLTSLLFAFFILCFATRNWIVSALAIVNIFTMVSVIKLYL